MSRIRIYQLAKDLNRSTKDIIDALAKLGVKVVGHNSTIDDYQAVKIRDYFVPKNVVQKPKLIIRKIGEVKEREAEAAAVAAAAAAEALKVESAPEVISKPIEAIPEMKKEGEKQENPSEIQKTKPQTIELPDTNKRLPQQVQRVITMKESETKPERRQETTIVIAPAPGEKPAGEAAPATTAAPKEEKKRDQKSDIKSKEERQELIKEKQSQRRQKREKKRKQKQDKEPVIEQEENVEDDGSVKIIQIDKQQFTIKELADTLRVGLGDIMKVVLSKGMLLTLNSEIDYSLAVQLAEPFNIVLEQKEVISKKQEREEAMLLSQLDEKEENLILRPAVVTIMGHVDHGKTKLLDTIRKANVVDKEAGGITQHIGAYQVKVKDKMITFLDTPGHEAFTEIRARGAQVTDIVVLIVAADDGVMPQTKEAIDHAKAAAVPIIVAINKVDKADADPERVKQQLTEFGLVTEEWGGDTVCIPISAKFGQGVEELLEMITLVAELKELKANPNKDAQGIIIEAKLTSNRGPVATAIIKSGTLRVGDSFVIGPIFGKVRAMLDYKGNPITEAPPSTPVEILGISQVPTTGDIVQVVKSEKEAKSIADKRRIELEEEKRRKRTLSLESFSKRIQEGEVATLNILIKADTQGSVDALEKSLTELYSEKVHLNIVHSGTGSITESDIMLAKVSEAIVFGFNVPVNGEVRKIAEDEGVDIKLYNIIYKIIEDVQSVLEGMEKPEFEKIRVGLIEVRALFTFSKVGAIAGCIVKSGRVQKSSNIVVVRNNAAIFEGRLSSLKRFQEDAKEVKEGYECGLVVKDFNDFQVGDLVEVYDLVEKK
ncbi:MAG: translation initiation factor IF-2 [Candidatus Margulisiibacteriota bacterium]|nr:MAG: hypothetical protein A2X43_14005 [Candidatus Margulisbacteria bacterium GWD2_39_127]OGI01595.1 MAG: hypothetical protein A2X42_08445 [Candidatus Margulisbacteria bacterium GWF2_38_17]OGI10037.1 MAG: hypothetical protein A2X41_09155 [Candidatus Margulisbacteria bacterium GWE2_39_32]PZM78292.1 MAG: translation initiation factor IF-2 [Candidatus Margulisiibacteriota bacterium]HAR62260.1 translation initiation factor IF-2 [Candidatus Margulisiibacteriota bacterium]